MIVSERKACERRGARQLSEILGGLLTLASPEMLTVIASKLEPSLKRTAADGRERARIAAGLAKLAAGVPASERRASPAPRKLSEIVAEFHAAGPAGGVRRPRADA